MLYFASNKISQFTRDFYGNNFLSRVECYKEMSLI